MEQPNLFTLKAQFEAILEKFKQETYDENAINPDDKEAFKFVLLNFGIEMNNLASDIIRKTDEEDDKNRVRTLHGEYLSTFKDFILAYIH